MVAGQEGDVWQTQGPESGDGAAKSPYLGGGEAPGGRTRCQLRLSAHGTTPAAMIPPDSTYKLRCKDETLSNSKAVTVEHGSQPHPSVDHGYTPMKLT